MMEVGPWVMEPDGSGLRTREGGWEEYTTMVYSASSIKIHGFLTKLTLTVDQPAGTGYSYTSTNRYVQELTEVLQQS
jgi:carboxypeptidase D